MRKLEFSVEGLKILKEQTEKRREEKPLGASEHARVAEALREADDRLKAAEARDGED